MILRLLEIGLAVSVAQLPLGEMVGKAERHVAADAGEHVEQHAKAFRASRTSSNTTQGPILGAQHGLGGEPDILLPVRPVDVAHLAQPLGAFQPFAQVVIGDVGAGIAAGIHGVSSRLTFTRRRTCAS